MASNYTEHYGLCQWEATDQVLREEFNEGNRKVDEALKELDDQVKTKAEQEALSEETAARTAAVKALEQKAGMKLISRTSLSQVTDWLKPDLTGIDWSKWATVRILMKPVLNEDVTYRAALNGSNLMYLGNYITGMFQVILFPSFCRDVGVLGLFYPHYLDKNTVSFDTPFHSLQYLEFISSKGDFLPGTVIEMWGAK